MAMLNFVGCSRAAGTRQALQLQGSLPKHAARAAAGVETALESIAAAAAASAAALLAGVARRAKSRRREQAEWRRRGDKMQELTDFLFLLSRSVGVSSTAAQSVTLKPLLRDSSFGAEVTGVDLGTPSLAEGLRSELRAALWRHGLLVFRSQDLRSEDVVRLAGLFAKPEAATGQESVVALYRVRDRDRTPRGQDFWHSDNSYCDPPGGPTVLYALQVPQGTDGKSLGDTLFADAAAAADALPQRLRSAVLGREARHNVAHNSGVPLPEFTSGEWLEAPDALHPVLRRHPLTGREVLFVNPAYVRAVEGLPQEASADVLQRLHQHCQQPEFCYAHNWQADDLVVWDNDRLLHKATTLDLPSGVERLMWRVQTLGPNIEH
eukprot:TRINITY_DN115084_c0_g1_i1.p1 TRINITY_DN115084_c0_g1~~TRINITY_DN115084_c0_g1_i1.p1  ORF type:complete len:379 (+),score=86.28 TRINITY_DN115084_c0_g1_i1:29-1165(+)